MGYTCSYDKTTGHACIFYNGQKFRWGPIAKLMTNNPYAGNFPQWLKRKHEEFVKKATYVELHVDCERTVFDRGYFQGFNHDFAALRNDFYWKVSVDQIAQSFRRKKSRWYQTNEYALLRRAITYHNNGLRKGDVRKVVIIGSGSLHDDIRQSGDPQDDWMTDTSAFQIAAADFIRQYLGETENPLPVFAQDPIYSQYDVAFLTRHLKFNVVYNPDIYRLIDEHTLVISLGTGRLTTYFMANIEGKIPMAMLCWHPDTQRGSREIHEAMVVDQRFARYNSYNIGGHSRLDFWSARKSWIETEKLWLRKRGS